MDLEIRLRKVSAEQLAQRVASYVPEPDMDSLRTVFAFYQTLSEVYTLVEANLAKFGLSQGKFGVLMLLLDRPEEGMAPSDLADLGGVTRGTITGLVDGLERQGLVERVHNPRDRRMLNVRLTPAGHALMGEVVPAHYQRMIRVVSGIRPEERALLRDMLDRMRSVGEADLCVTSAREE